MPTTSNSPSDTMIRPQEGRQRMFMESSADIAIYGGAAGGGKTFALEMEPLYHVALPTFGCIIFRRTYPQINNQGGLWDESMEIYPFLTPAPTPRAGALEWIFPSGARVSFRHMQHPTSYLDYQGSQIPLICWDQLEQFTEKQFFFMMSRNRSLCGIKPYIRATANPEPGWLAEFIDWWLEEDGYANLDRIGKIRWMIRSGNTIEWDDTRQGLIDRFKDTVDEDYLKPKSVTFIPASVFDNKILMEKDPGYVANLLALPELERKRLLGDKLRGGNWHVKPGGTHFKREWFKIVPEQPAGLNFLVRYWDLAATEEKAGCDPDFTCGTLMGEQDGVFYVCDVRLDRLSPMHTENLVLQTALVDGDETIVRMEQEPGASGKTVIDHYARIVLKGFNFMGNPARGDKALRASPMSAAAESGNIRLVAGAWNKSWLEEYESFSPECIHDDQVDSGSGAFNYIRANILDAHVGRGLPTSRPEDRLLTRQSEQLEELLAAMTPEDRLLAEHLLRKQGIH